MTTSASTEKIVGAVFGGIMIIYLVANTFSDAGEELDGINESVKGGKFMKLAPLFLAFGVIYALYKMFIHKH